MSKKKKWWHTASWKGNELNPDLFGKSIQQHSADLKKKGFLDEDGFEILPEDEVGDDVGYSSHNWELDKKLVDNKHNFKDKKEKYEWNKQQYGNAYNSYEKTGVWEGYSRVPQLTYKYVQQMANALSAQHNIKVRIGNDWRVDLIKKELTYNPASLIYGTKSELLATLMHEIGKLRYVTHHSLLKNKYISMYKAPALEVLSIFEDLRTDFLMLKAYESASEIYESVIPTVEKQVKGYMEFGETYREVIEKVAENVFGRIVDSYERETGLKTLNPADPKLKEILFKTYGTSDLDTVKIGMGVLKSNLKNNGTIYEYCGEMLSVMYDLDDQKHKKFENIKDRVGKTIKTIEPSKKSVNSQGLVDYLDTDVYPVVEDLLKDAKDKNEQIQKAFPQMPEQVMKEMMKEVEQYMRHHSKNTNLDDKGNTKTRTSGKTNNTIPPEWLSGDYKTLKDSVSMEIRQLVSRLTFLRREELVVRFQGEQKRGKLNAKSLYKHLLGSTRLFKKKLENVDTVRSFAFSVLIDKSGSMGGTRMVHCTRALIILAEVFKQMHIPFELVTFSTGAKTIKSFDEDMEKKIEGKIGGLVTSANGGTNLNEGLEQIKIQHQPERNKVLIVLTDGGVGDVQYYDQQFFVPMSKKGIKSVGFGIECESQMKDLCMSNSKLLDNASELPEEFSTLLKNLIKR